MTNAKMLGPLKARGVEDRRWMVEKLEKFDHVFRPHVRLNAKNYLLSNGSGAEK